MQTHLAVLPAVTLAAVAMLAASGCVSAPKAADAAPPTDGAVAADPAASGAGAQPGDAAGPAAAAAILEPAPPPEDPSMPADQFAQAVVRSDLQQIALGTLAAQHGEAQEVRDLGQRMSTNHTAIQVIVAKAAAKQGMSLPTALDGDDAAAVERLGALRGAEFDQAYMMFMAGETARMLALYRWQYDNCTNADIKPFAMQTMPIIAVHARVADELNKVVNKEALRLAAERKAAEAQAAAQRKAEEEAAAAAAAAKKKPTRKPTRRSSTSSSQG
jgi:putative membrane protein